MPTNIWPEWSAKLAGGWKCIAFEMLDSNQNVIAKPYEDNPMGRLLISPNGFLSSHIVDPKRVGPLPSGKDWFVAEDKELAHVARGLSTYCGYLQLFEDEKGLYWETKVEVGTDPTWIGGSQTRRVELVYECGKELMVLRPKQELALLVVSADNNRNVELLE